MARTFATAVLFAASLSVSVPEIATAQHSVGPRGFGGVPHPGVGPRFGGGFGFFGPRLHLGPLPYPNRHANPIWQLHPNLYPKINIPGSHTAGYSFGHFPTVGSYAHPGIFSSGYVIPFGYGYDPPVTYAPSITVVIPQTSDLPDLPPPPKRTAVTAEDVAEIQVRVPPEATVWLDGVESTLAGTHRDFATPPLPPGLFTTYEIRARWTEDGREIDQTRRLPVRAGGRYVVDFTAADDLSDPSR